MIPCRPSAERTRSQWCSYDDITAMCIEIGQKQYYNSNNDTKKKLIQINPSFQVDLKEWMEVDNDDVKVSKRIRRVKNL